MTTTMTLPKDIYYQIFDKIKDTKSIIRLAKTCKSNNYIYNNGKHKAKHELDKYQVDYKDPRNFIYVYNHRPTPFTKDGYYDLIEILKIYMLQFNTKRIECRELAITSFPVYPNMTFCDLSYNDLTHFATQPVMTECYIHDNLLASFPTQPVMTKCYIYHNRLTNFQIQPMMIRILMDNDYYLGNQPKIILE